MMNNWGCLLITAVTGLAFVVSSAERNVTECEELYHPYGPCIVPSKKEIILQKGQNFTLKCRSSTNIKFNQQDAPEEIIGDFAIKTRKVIHENDIDKYEIALDLVNVDRYAIGYYACKDSSVTDDVLNYLTMEPNNTELVSYIYVYVNGTDSLFAPMREVVLSRSGYYIVECRPSTPEVEVKIMLSDIAVNTYTRYSPKLGFVFDSDSIEVLVDPVPTTLFTCHCEKQHITEEKDLIFVKQQKSHPQPTVLGKYHNFLPGETFSLNCSVVYKTDTAHNLTWKYPNNYVRDTVEIDNNNSNVTAGSTLYNNIIIRNASKLHAGKYTCVSQVHCAYKEATFQKIYLDKPLLTMKKISKVNIYETPQNSLTLSAELISYPPANLTYFKNNIEIKTRKNGTYEMKMSNFSNDVFFKVKKHSVEDSANYTIVAKNGNNTVQVNYDLRFCTAPTVNFGNSDKICDYNTKISLVCDVTGYYLPNITWILYNSHIHNTSQMLSDEVEVLSVYKEKATLKVNCNFLGSVMCIATNTISNIVHSVNQTRNLIVYEVSNGFGIIDQALKKNGHKPAWFPQGEDVSITCLASKHEFASVVWIMANKSDVEEINDSPSTTFSLKAKLKINNISLNDNGTYVCRGLAHNGTVIEDTIDITVAALQPPALTFYSDVNGTVQTFQPVYINCIAHGIPLPTVTWLKDNAELTINGSNRFIVSNALNQTTVNTSIIIEQLKNEHIGTYECVADSKAGQVKETIKLVLKVTETEPSYTKYYIVIGVIIFVAIILVIYLICKIKKEKQFRKQLAAAGLLYFKEGVTKSINPDLGIDEQAELLPYDEKFEFSLDKLNIGKQLGAGAFGVVYKAEARGIINAEETTPVAVKMVKKTADNMYIKALASELKIMVHLGKHINIVNLLGACTKNIGKRELMVIVEYCKFGNIHNYMQRHRDVFIDQFSDNNKDMSYGKVNRGYDTSGSTGLQSDYGTANTQDTLLTNNTNRTCRKNVPSQPTEVVKVSEGYVQPEWRSNYESDYSYDGRAPRPLTSRDLLAWAFQIARGMEYLASRKVLHGDLAARNILLADDNIVKICDFGLARSIYKNDEYKKKENSPLPVKWLAIECISDSIFSTQSDVWSFGVVLWELFSLAKTPYPNLDPRNILQFLTEGHRLDKPAYADDRIYSLMKRCWEQKPTMRPSFTQLQEILGTFLEDNVRNHYVDLNSEFMDQNSKPEGQEDYLAMMCAPDYNNLVTPSPHHYVNGINNARSFFPNPPKLDEEGYLQMSPNSSHDIFSPKATDTKFDFDPRKFNSRPSVASSCGSELTPMLTLNNLPRNGSDSDQEGNTSPYLKVCPRIEEETDEVFEIKQNNAKNAQNTAVSNPTYITFDIDVEKKTPIDINRYVNIVPNGLVK